MLTQTQIDSIWCRFAMALAVLAVALLSAPSPLAAQADPTEALKSKNGESQDAESPAGDLPLDVRALAARCKPSLYVIHGTGRDGRQDRIGTGFAVGPDLIATNLHVIGEGRAFTIEDTQGRELVAEAVLASDRLFDLAVVRVQPDEEHPLKPLELGDPRMLTDGEPVVVLGNPLGYKHSVVSGVLSGKRQIEGRNMLQLAVPIEPGNSGGPVLNREGKVFGVVTMKSAASNNLGFAVESSALQRLIENPNPVKMTRWVAMNRIDTGKWEPLFGARWQQRGGKVLVDGQGDGFGGRSLCLWRQAPPQVPFEVVVDVKLDDEAGAAGLVFHSDGKDRHYGFYPSNGQLRLSCFQGPSVYSWKVLRDEPSDYYRPGDWNRLKVRVEDDLLRCFVNGELVFQASDSTFQSGQVGLAKFRRTEAEFRGFQVADEIRSEGLDEATKTDLLAEINKLAALKETSPAELEALVEYPGASRRLLDEQAKALEQRAQELRKIARDVHVTAVAEQLGQLFKPEGESQEAESEEGGNRNGNADNRPDLLRAALLVARLDDEELDIEAYLEAVDRMAAEVSDKLQAEPGQTESEQTESGQTESGQAESGKAGDRRRLDALNTYLFEDNGYHGSRADYYHRANSHIHRVIDDREGLPITLSILYMELGERLGLNIEGISLPGHFLVNYRPGQSQRPGQPTPDISEEPILIDVYEGGVPLSWEDASRKAREITGEPLQTVPLPRATTREIVQRMLVNLLNVAQQEADEEAMLRYLHGLLAIDSDSVQYRGMRAMVLFETGRRDAALKDLDWILDEQPEGLDMQRIRQLRDYFQHSRPG